MSREERKDPIMNRPLPSAGPIVVGVDGSAGSKAATAAGEPTMSTNPVIDYHLVYALVLIALAATAAGAAWGLGNLWSRIPFVDHNRWLR